MTDWLKRDSHVPFDLLPQPKWPPYSQLSNPGLQVLNDAPAPSEATILIVGLPRSGTSMVSVALEKLGVFLGDRATSPVFEDLKLAEIIENGGDPASVIDDYNRRHSLWAYKRPMAFETIERHLYLFRNPRFIISFRDLVAIAQREQVSMTGDFRKHLEQSLIRSIDLLRFAFRQTAPTMLFSYEKAIQEPSYFIDALAQFSSVIPLEAKNRESAVMSVENSPREYLAKSQVKIPQEAFTVPDRRTS